ncbi:MAG TPA: glutamate--cysteine ligase [Actinocrinis sp.]|uniref:carboxylate-amine ligase n=1 Tax=Actinocrinis sp. TaxID=1920516 RepID=UPI002DDCF1E3|nr:glutamate--cysteine ligase [Actinocrinis sp.]HEV2345926.1 glutamate--cysteine ligase [Actinocrinis sp.]
MSVPNGAARPQFGVEEEFLLVDPVSRAPAPVAPAVVGHAVELLGGGRVGGEITELQLEARTDPCVTADQLYAQLAEGRRVAAHAARASGAAIVATGTPVLGGTIPPPMGRGERQDRGNATFRGLHNELAICALHVHVELPERDLAVMVSNHLRPHLPVLIALTANSPYWADRDTGYASWRTVIWTRWPVAGPPPYFDSAEHYERHVETLLGAGALVDRGTIFWDVRPSSKLPTLEIRIADVPVTAEESAAVAALVRALVVRALRKARHGDPGPRVPGELMRLAYWRAARDGIEGHGVDVFTGSLLPAMRLARDLVATARPVLLEYGEADRVDDWLNRLEREGGGAARQRRAGAGPGGLAGVVDYLVEHTAAHTAAHTETVARHADEDPGNPAVASAGVDM